MRASNKPKKATPKKGGLPNFVSAYATCKAGGEHIELRTSVDFRKDPSETVTVCITDKAGFYEVKEIPFAAFKKNVESGKWSFAMGSPIA